MTRIQTGPDSTVESSWLMWPGLRLKICFCSLYSMKYYGTFIVWKALTNKLDHFCWPFSSENM